MNAFEFGGIVGEILRYILAGYLGYKFFGWIIKKFKKKKIEE